MECKSVLVYSISVIVLGEIKHFSFLNLYYLVYQSENFPCKLDDIFSFPLRTIHDLRIGK